MWTFNKPSTVPEVVEKVDHISEPILSFVATVKDNPKRFKVKKILTRAGYTYYFKDRHLNKSWSFFIGYCPYDRVSLLGLPAWITVEEERFIYKELSPIFGRQRKDKLHKIQRERMKRLYN